MITRMSVLAKMVPAEQLPRHLGHRVRFEGLDGTLIAARAGGSHTEITLDENPVYRWLIANRQMVAVLP